MKNLSFKIFKEEFPEAECRKHPRMDRVYIATLKCIAQDTSVRHIALVWDVECEDGMIFRDGEMIDSGRSLRELKMIYKVTA